MKKKQEHFLGFSIILMTIFVLVGCATAVPIKSVRTPTIDTTGIQSLAIRPFVNKSGVEGQIGAQLTNYLTDTVTEKIKGLGKFYIVAPDDPNADGIFAGEIRNIIIVETQSQYSYERNVTVEFRYSVIDPRTQMEIGYVTKQGSLKSSNTKVDVFTIARRIIDSQLKSLEQDIVPTIVNTNHNLMKETSKDKALKQKMTEVEALVKNGNYEEAIMQYEAISSEYGSDAAKSNAKILREAISSDIAARERLTMLLNEDKSVENTFNDAINWLNSKLPSETTIAIMRTSSTETRIADDVVDRMTKTFIQGGKIKIVDRTNQALINAEQNFQLSGNVSDESMVSIGRQLGAQYIVTCWISGVMSSRRLNLRVLSIETAQIIDQNDFEI